MPDSLSGKLPENLPTLDPQTATLEQLQEAVGSKKTNCALATAEFNCTDDNPAPPNASLPLIELKAGDEFGMNNFKFVAVEVTGGMNGYSGTAIVKVPFMNNTRIGVSISGLKVVEGGCAIAGTLTTEGLDIGLLSKTQREQLTKIYTAAMASANFLQQNAGLVAATYNTFRDLLLGTQKNAQLLVDKLTNSETLSKEELTKTIKLQKNGKEKLEKALKLFDETYPAPLADSLVSKRAAIVQCIASITVCLPCVETALAASTAPATTTPKGPFFNDEILADDCLKTTLSTVAKSDFAAAADAVDGMTDITCNCAGGPSDCDEISIIFNNIKEANKTENKMLNFDKNTGFVDYENNGTSALTGIDVGGKCYHVKIENKFSTGTIKLDMTDFQLDNAGERILLKDKNDQEAVVINRLPKTKGTFQDLVNYLGFGKSTATFPITGAQLHSIFPGTSQARSDEVAALINKYSDKFEINSALRMAHFLAQTGFESSGYTANKGAESGCYSSKNASWSGWIANKSWIEPTFTKGCFGYTDAKYKTKKLPWNSIADVPAKYICGNGNSSEVATKNLFSYVYQCEGGNSDEASTDGYKYRGHGWIQLTWKKQYIEFNNWMKKNTPDDFKDVVENSNLIGEDKTIDAISGMWYWNSRGLNKTADTLKEGCSLLKFESITKKINSAALDNDKRKEIFDNAIKLIK